MKSARKTWSCIIFFWMNIEIFLSAKTVPKDYTSYSIYPWCTPSDYMRYPISVQEVVDIIQEAIKRGVTVKAFGIRHSQTDIICTEGIPIDMRGMKSFKINADNTATLGSGLTLHEATGYLKEHGRAFKTTPAFGNITLGGAIGTGSHGSSIKYTSSLSSQVVGMTIVDGFGNLRTISDETELNAFRIHLGVLGIVIDVTLTTTPLYKTLAFNHIVHDTVLTDGTALEWARSADQMSLYWFPSFGEVIVANWTIVDVSTPGNAKTNDHVPSTYDSFSIPVSEIGEIAFDLTASDCSVASELGYSIAHTFEYLLQQTLWKQTPNFVPIYTEDGYTLKMPAVGYYDEMFAPVCLETPTDIFGTACVWAHGFTKSNITLLDNEFGIALSDLPEFIRIVKDIVKKTPTVFPMQGILMRFSAASAIYMSEAYGRDTVHFEFYLVKRKNPYDNPSSSLAGYQTILQTAAKTFNGRSHWGKSGFVYHNRESIARKLDPTARQNFIDVMKKYDPNGVYINNFGRRLEGTGTRVDFDPKTTRCALLDNCFCTSNSECGITQTCTQLPGYDFKVCKTRNEVPEVNFVGGMPLPPGLGVLNWLIGILPTALATVNLHCNVLSLLGSDSD